jgi:hypothetical protein
MFLCQAKRATNLSANVKTWNATAAGDEANVKTWNATAAGDDDTHVSKFVSQILLSVHTRQRT